MKLKVLLLIAPVLTISVSVFASTAKDSIGVENQNGKKIILHKLDPKDNYYSIGRRYKVSPKAIIQFNNNAPLKIGGTIKVPTDLPFDETQAVTTAQPAKPAVQPVVVQQKPQVQPPVAKTPTVVQQPVAQPQPVVQQPVAAAPKPATPAPPTTQPSAAVNMDNVQQYKVSAGETIYSIAKRFNTSVEDIRNLNNLSSDDLKADQIIKVRTGMPPEERTVAKQDVLKTDSANMPIDSADAKFKANRFGLYEKNEKGVATWIDDTSLDPKKELVLHRTAPIGTVIKITNPMNNHTTYAKVVGRFTDSEATKNVLIVMTKNTADALGALDKRINVNISYGSPNE
ncbi:LysM peptidoglycan-binding domain-containing protein [Mucilaginibacter ginsenosidivorax]|uniref:LysM peptidoglycan-binding domain-containing protein n=1 Tax=Mucilaginibacter ginsenosidivorax TaxID=862126 RepID=A0A5B8VU10_9SPHI|nr:LysM peptidoglycan-binding domain-containing protein [Mucilaginibacter ginsenosidivorax]QEC75134.1 LysM peptidoglycan-binding domain-containing protein [Mucilaginibacter ginsenosidivorax]